MPTGDWCKGKSKTQDERVKQMAENVSKAHRDPELRKRLDAKKTLSPEQLNEMLKAAKTKWTFLSDFTKEYTKKSTKNLRAICQFGHEETLSFTDVITDKRCKVCVPNQSGKNNPAYKPFSKFLSLLFENFEKDAFLFDQEQYSGMYGDMTFRCMQCDFEFVKKPRALVKQKIGCPRCAHQANTDALSRSEETFLLLVKKLYGDRFIFHPSEDQRYTNGSVISRTCLKCNVKRDQPIGSLLAGNACPVCSGRVKYTTETFIEKSKKIWGESEFDYTQVSYVHNHFPVTLTCKKGHTFQSQPANHFNKKGCAECAVKKFVSAGETEWLDSLSIPKENRNVRINVENQQLNVDALINGTIYEYYGDFWHGNLRRFHPDNVNVYSGMTMQEHYDHTLAREQLLRNAGYVVVTMWEFDWIKFRKTRPSTA